MRFDWSLVGQNSAHRLPVGSSLAHGCAYLGALLWGMAEVFDWSLVGQNLALRLPFGSSLRHGCAYLGAGGSV